MRRTDKGGLSATIFQDFYVVIRFRIAFPSPLAFFWAPLLVPQRNKEHPLWTGDVPDSGYFKPNVNSVTSHQQRMPPGKYAYEDI